MTFLWEHLFVKGFTKCIIENGNIIFSKGVTDDPIDGSPRTSITVRHGDDILAVDLDEEKGMSELMSTILRFEGTVWVDDMWYDVDIK